MVSGIRTNPNLYLLSLTLLFTQVGFRGDDLSPTKEVKSAKYIKVIADIFKKSGLENQDDYELQLEQAELKISWAQILYLLSADSLQNASAKIPELAKTYKAKKN